MFGAGALLVFRSVSHSVRVPGGWSEAHCYMWTDGSGNNGEWPGPKMTATSESGVYSYTVTGNFSNIIFNNGNSGVGTNQTGDMAYSNYNGYICDLSKGVSSPSWSVYPGGGDTTNPTVPPTNPPGDFVIYLKNSAKWSAPTCYMWNGSGGHLRQRYFQQQQRQQSDPQSAGTQQLYL